MSGGGWREEARERLEDATEYQGHAGSRWVSVELPLLAGTDEPMEVTLTWDAEIGRWRWDEIRPPDASPMVVHGIVSPRHARRIAATVAALTRRGLTPGKILRTLWELDDLNETDDDYLRILEEMGP